MFAQGGFVFQRIEKSDEACPFFKPEHSVRCQRVHHPGPERNVFASGFKSSSFTHVCFRLSLPVNLRPKPFSPSRKNVSLPISILMIYIFPVVLSLNLSPIFITAPSPFLGSCETITV